MSNNYLQFSIELVPVKGKTDEIKEIFQQLEDWESMENTSHVVFQSGAGQELMQVIIDEEHVGFTVQIHEDELFVYAEEYGSPEQAALFIQTLMVNNLVLFENFILLTWAETCSKPRPDEFGGGACMITPKEIHWRESAHQWANDLFATHG